MPGTASVSHSRATLCEILAIRTLRDYGNSMIDLTVILTTSWPGVCLECSKMDR
jgi:hypothetical protein